MDGVININKPVGITSFDVVRSVMKICGTKKVGHTGTLDPLASGVLPICIGRATKIVDYIMEETKVYQAELMLGIKTDTYDREGKILSQKSVVVSEEAIFQAFNSFLGEILQEPPMFSALKVNGKRLYELARQGITIDRNMRKVNIYNLEILAISLPVVTFRVTCSKGTYIRSLCNDIGEKLGLGGTMWSLNRVQTGVFSLDNAVDLSSINKDNIAQYIIPIEDALEKYDKLSFNSKVEKLLLNGVKINNEYLLKGIDQNKIYRVYLNEEKFIGLGIRDDIGFKIINLLV
jgi:tRNA pseudouridine55 synthase